MKHCFAFFFYYLRVIPLHLLHACAKMLIYVASQRFILRYIKFLVLSPQIHNAQMHSSMIKFFTCFLIFQGRLSVDIAAYCAPSLCSFTHAWFHKRCTISNLDFGCSCPFGYLEKLRLHILCLFAVQQFLHLQPFLVSLCY